MHGSDINRIWIGNKQIGQDLIDFVIKDVETIGDVDEFCTYTDDNCGFTEAF